MTTVRLTDGRVLQLDADPVGTGAEKRVFLTRDRQHAVGFYYGHLSDRRERLDRLTRILTNYNPTLANNGAYWAPYFCWPVGMSEGTGAIPRDFAATASVGVATTRRRHAHLSQQLLFPRSVGHAPRKRGTLFWRQSVALGAARRSGHAAHQATNRCAIGARGTAPAHGRPRARGRCPTKTSSMIRVAVMPVSSTSIHSSCPVLHRHRC